MELLRIKSEIALKCIELLAFFNLQQGRELIRAAIIELGKQQEGGGDKGQRWCSGSDKSFTVFFSMPDPAIDLLFPNGMHDVIEEFFRYNLIKMENNYFISPISSLKGAIGLKVAECLRFYLSELLPYRNNLAALLRWAYNPLKAHISEQLALQWEVVDLIWSLAEEAGDHDLNYYTKRLILLGIYKRALFFIIAAEQEPTQEQITRFIEQDINKVKQFTRFRKKISENLLRIIGFSRDK